MRTIKKTLLLIILVMITVCIRAQDHNSKLRVLVLTDIENEPDDAQSMVRFLAYSNNWDVEGLIATTSVHQKKKVAAWRIKEIVSAYGQVRTNLLLHEKGYPDTNYLKSIIKESYPDFGMAAIGNGKDSEGSEWLIKTVDKEDNRPVWVLVWGGPNCLAQALWKVHMTRSPDDINKFVSKLRVYTISDQDDTGPWIRKTFPTLFYICSPGTHDRGAYHHATWTGISGDKFHGRFSGADFSIVDNPWLDKNIRKDHGPLGAQHPFTKYLMEGDSPSFLYLVDNGLGSPEYPNYGSWGGRYELYQPKTEKWFYEPETRPIWTNAEDEVMGIDSTFQTSNKATIWRWRKAYQNDFAARINWSIQPYKNANHPPVAKLAHPNNLHVKIGDTVLLNASPSTDPDGNQLSYEWIEYPEVGTYAARNTLKIEHEKTAKASFIAPNVTRPETIHIILAVSDNGTPALTRYQRVIVTVFP
ncbi:MAG: hypothetical protein JWP81_1600 [Ferruginibacter sp.]|nr:hypothetical protein [Ferruginibacter sp.]